MQLIVVLAVTLVAVCLLREPIRHIPWLFYAVALVLVALLLSGEVFNMPKALRDIFLVLLQKGALGIAMFALVMWIGVLPRGGKASKWLRPIRAELSVLACILIAGHMIVYLEAYVGRLFSALALKTNVAVSLVIALCLLALIFVLGITSFKTVKRHMNVHSWRKLQTLAYVFYGLVFAHIMMMLGFSAANGGVNAITTVAVYGVVFGGYTICRILRAIQDKKESVDLAETVRNQGFEA